MGDAVKHTPGPWKASQTYPLGDYCIHARGIPFQLAYLAAHSKVDWPIEANARLIAAAPELLAALEALLKDYLAVFEDHPTIEPGWNQENSGLVKQVRAAIARATGAQP